MSAAAEDEREGFAAFLMRMRRRGVDSRAIFAAMEQTPRGGFIPPRWRDAAWSNRMVPIECGETIEGSDLQATMIAALEVEPTQRVLEIGTGSGYTAAILARLAGRVLTLDRFRTLSEQAQQRFERLEIKNVIARHADGKDGAAADGPFDRIIVWAAFEENPRSFAEQLTSGGIMVAPIGPGEGPQSIVKLVKTGSRFERTNFEEARLQPLAASASEKI